MTAIVQKFAKVLHFMNSRYFESLIAATTHQTVLELTTVYKIDELYLIISVSPIRHSKCTLAVKLTLSKLAFIRKVDNGLRFTQLFSDSIDFPPIKNAFKQIPITVDSAAIILHRAVDKQANQNVSVRSNIQVPSVQGATIEDIPGNKH